MRIASPIAVPLASVVLIGMASGICGFTFVYARGGSYLLDDPSACANCHVMREQYDDWNRGSHHAVATCNDCHTPHDLLGKYRTKAANGFRHSLAFTTGRFAEPIRITTRNRAIAQEACRSCHAAIVEMIDSPHLGNDALDCLACHRSVGHLH